MLAQIPSGLASSGFIEDVPKTAMLRQFGCFCSFEQLCIADELQRRTISS